MSKTAGGKSKHQSAKGGSASHHRPTPYSRCFRNRPGSLCHAASDTSDQQFNKTREYNDLVEALNDLPETYSKPDLTSPIAITQSATEAIKMLMAEWKVLSQLATEIGIDAAVLD